MHEPLSSWTVTQPDTAGREILYRYLQPTDDI